MLLPLLVVCWSALNTSGGIHVLLLSLEHRELGSSRLITLSFWHHDDTGTYQYIQPISHLPLRCYLRLCLCIHWSAPQSVITYVSCHGIVLLLVLSAGSHYGCQKHGVSFLFLFFPFLPCQLPPDYCNLILRFNVYGLASWTY